MSQRLQAVAAPVIIVVAVVLVYFRGLPYPFIWDDQDAIVNNPSIRQVWPVLRAPADSPTARRPVANYTFALNYALGGLNPWDYRATDLLIHAGCALLLLGVLRRSMALATGGTSSWPGMFAFSVSLLWAVHPLLSETVVYVTQRTELLMALFYLLTLYCAIRGFESAAPGGWYAGAIAACAMGMGSKEVMLSAPIVVLLFDYVFLTGSLARSLKLRPRLYAGLGATWLIVIVITAVSPKFKIAGFGLDMSPWTYLKMQCQVVVHYLRLCFWPSPLLIDYLGWRPPTFMQAAPYAAVLVALFVASIWLVYRRKPAGLLGIVFFLLLGPSSSIFPLISEVAAERRMYLPAACVIAITVFAFGAIFTRWLQPFSEKLRAGAAIVGSVTVAAILAITTHQRVADYRSSLSLWADSVEKWPRSHRAQNNLASDLILAGHLEDAEKHLRLALQLADGAADPHYNLGVCLSGQGRIDEAIDEYRQAIRISPDRADARANLARLFISLSRFADAQQELQQGLAYTPHDASIHALVGVALAGQRKFDEADAEFAKAVQDDPNDPVTWNNWGSILIDQGKPVEAIEKIKRALHLKNDYVNARQNMARAEAALPH